MRLIVPELFDAVRDAANTHCGPFTAHEITERVHRGYHINSGRKATDFDVARMLPDLVSNHRSHVVLYPDHIMEAVVYCRLMDYKPKSRIGFI
jgi:hypothetical protein